MITFSDPRYLFGLLVLLPIALFAALAVRRARRALWRLVGERRDHALLEQRAPRRRTVSFVLVGLVIAALVVGAAGPQWGREMVRRAATGSDLVFVMDVSASMDARDVPPSRLDEARREALAVLDRIEGSRAGVVAFAGDAVRLTPLTSDRGALQLVLESITTSSVSEPGTDLGRALRVAVATMPAGRREEQAIVLWTDGEDLENGARDQIDAVARTGIRVFAIGVGTPAGDVVPVLDDQGRAVDIKKDENGAAVRSRLDADLLRTLARRTGGSYFEASRPGGELPRLLASLTRLARAAHGSRLIEQPVARFPLFAALAVLLLTLELVLPRRREPRGGAGEAPAPQRARDLKAAAAVVLLAPLAALALLPSPAHAQSAWAKGDREFKGERFAEAESLYSLRLRHKAPDDVRVNRATARALKGETETAVPDLEHLAKSDNRAGHAAGYNLGTVEGNQKQYAPALQALRRVLEKDPNDQDARWNYEVLAHRQEMEKQKKNQPPQQKKSGGGGGQQNQNPQPSPSNQQPQAPQPSSGNQQQQQQQQPNNGSTMDRAQAERLLGALEEMERAEQERQRRVSVKRDKRGKDW